MHIPAIFAERHTELVPLPLAKSNNLKERLFAAAQCGEAHAIANAKHQSAAELSSDLTSAAAHCSRSDDLGTAAFERAAFVMSAYRVVRAQTPPRNRNTRISVYGAYHQHNMMRIMFSGPALWAQLCHATPSRIVPADCDVLGSYRAAAAALALARPTCRVFLPTIIEDVCCKVDLIAFDETATYILQIRGGGRVRVLDVHEQENDEMRQRLTSACGEFRSRYGIVCTAKYIEMPGSARQLRDQIARCAS